MIKLAETFGVFGTNGFFPDPNPGEKEQQYIQRFFLRNPNLSFEQFQGQAGQFFNQTISTINSSEHLATSTPANQKPNVFSIGIPTIIIIGGIAAFLLLSRN